MKHQHHNLKFLLCVSNPTNTCGFFFWCNNFVFDRVQMTLLFLATGQKVVSAIIIWCAVHDSICSRIMSTDTGRQHLVFCLLKFKDFLQQSLSTHFITFPQSCGLLKVISTVMWSFESNFHSHMVFWKSFPQSFKLTLSLPCLPHRHSKNNGYNSNGSAKFEIITAFPPLHMSTWKDFHQNTQYCKYAVCRHICVHFPAWKIYELGQLKG